MKYALDASMSKETDGFTINKMGVPSVVLMERAAYEVAKNTAAVAARFSRKVRICAVCGTGNNGADGVAAARILTWQQLPVDIIMTGKELSYTDELKTQLKIARNSSMNFANIQNIPEYDIVIDALFGIGLKRDVTGEYALITDLINNSENVVVSVDIPSGINAGTGRIMNKAVRADLTVTFGYNKIGMMLNPGKFMCGDVVVADIGFAPAAVDNINPAMYFTEDDIYNIPERLKDSNKGTYGRTLIIAGSAAMSGAAYLSAAAAFRTGTSYVEIFTSEENNRILRTLLPEAIVTGYNRENYKKLLECAMEKADTIVIGPGISMDNMAQDIVRITMNKTHGTIVADADALNIMAEHREILKNHDSTVIITPHIKEMERLSGFTKEEITSDVISAASKISGEYKVICVLKDAVTIAVDCRDEKRKRVCINNSGCEAMSKAGMGDTLTGVIASMLALRLEPLSAAAMGVYIHGLAGQMAAENVSEHSIIPSDMLGMFGKVMRKRK